MTVEWKNEYSVNVAEIDAQHKIFISILNKLYSAIANYSLDKDLTLILKELTEYTQEHFSTEEHYFEKFQYENTLEHKKEHKELTEKIIRFTELHVQGKENITLDLVDFLENWLITHLANQDKKYTACFNSHGLF